MDHRFQYEEVDINDVNKVKVFEKECCGLYQPSSKAMMEMPQMRLVTHSKNGNKIITSTTESIAQSFTADGYQAPNHSAVKRICSTLHTYSASEIIKGYDNLDGLLALIKLNNPDFHYVLDLDKD